VSLQLPTRPESMSTAEFARLVHSRTLADRYAALADHPFERRRTDRTLRGLDLAIAGTVLVVASPLLALMALAVALTSGRPILYRGPRVGRAGRIFTMYKLRTLRPHAEERIGHLQDVALDEITVSEHTPIGRVLRATQLDELPQLWNVLRGDMSMVGPRPLRPQFYGELSASTPGMWQRFAVRPGVTGFAQMRQDNVTPWEWKLAHDLEYVADRSLGLYARCCGETALRVAAQTARGLASVGRRRRPPTGPTA
jgi:lipopolysaccharide/colanic/teichoic acid biosynthesis glycosyltransferase